MSIETKSMHITPAGGNIFADLGFDEDEAKALKVEAQRIISEKLAIKESLMGELARWIELKKLKTGEAAKILGVTRPRVSNVIHKKTEKFTIDALVDMLERTGKQVRLLVG